jgi:hypothetical protein
MLFSRIPCLKIHKYTSLSSLKILKIRKKNMGRARIMAISFKAMKKVGEPFRKMHPKIVSFTRFRVLGK